MVVLLFRILEFLEAKRKAHPKVTRWVSGVICFSVAGITTHLLGLDRAINPRFWPKVPTVAEKFLSYGAVLSFTITSATTFLLEAFLINSVFPLLTFIPQAVAMKALGVKRATQSVTPKEMVLLFGKYKSTHPEMEPIRVLCISGGSLLRDANSSSAILREAAQRGLLQVILPRPVPANPTILARFGSYSSNYRSSNCPDISRIIRDIEDTKSFLLSANRGNEVYEHDELVVWRLILLKEYCFAQNYLPNTSGGHIIDSPLFVYGESETESGKHPQIAQFSFYQCYSAYWNALKTRCVDYPNAAAQKQIATRKPATKSKA